MLCLFLSDGSLINFQKPNIQNQPMIQNTRELEFMMVSSEKVSLWASLSDQECEVFSI